MRGTGVVVAYYAIVPHQVRREQVSSAMAGGVTVIPAYLLARLALDVTLHGAGAVLTGGWTPYPATDDRDVERERQRRFALISLRATVDT